MDTPHKSYKAQSPHGILDSQLQRFPAIQGDAFRTDPAVCESIISDVLLGWIFYAESSLIQQGKISNAGVDAEEAMKLYLDRVDAGSLDQETLLYKLVYDSRMAQRALTRSVTADGLMRYAHQAGYHIFQATMTAEKFWLLAEERVIQNGRKTAKKYRQSVIQQNAIKTEIASKKHQDWQKYANDVWKKHPNHSKSLVAKIIKRNKKISDSENTIRLKIEKVDRAK